MLTAAVNIDADLGWDHGVALAEGVGVDERTAAMPVFRRTLRVHDLQHGLRLPRAAEDAVFLAGERIPLVAVGEGKHIGRIEMAVVLRVVGGRRREAVIEETEAAAGDVRHHAIEDLPALLVGVEAVVKKLPQAAAALRHTEAISVLDGRLAIGAAERIV